MNYETVILGSGYFALGYASTHENTLIIEETQLLDPHFFGALSGFECGEQGVCAEGASALREAFVKEGVCLGGRLSVNELEPALCRFAERKMPDILLGSLCSDIKIGGDGFLLEICNNEGISRVVARRVIDTRMGKGSRLNFLLAVNPENLPRIEGLSPAFYPDQAVASLDFDGLRDINEAKSRGLEILDGALREAGARIVCTSYRMENAKKREPYTDENGIFYIDETNMGGIFAAYEKGELFDDTFAS